MNLIRYGLVAGVVVVGIVGCDAKPRAVTDESSPVVAVAGGDPAGRAMEMWAQSCALCHVDGNAGAPRVGNADEWSPRLAQGRELLLQHTVEGLNQMPPLGYCMACERDDFLTMIDFMTAGLVQAQEGRP